MQTLLSLRIFTFMINLTIISKYLYCLTASISWQSSLCACDMTSIMSHAQSACDMMLCGKANLLMDLNGHNRNTERWN